MNLWNIQSVKRGFFLACLVILILCSIGTGLTAVFRTIQQMWKLQEEREAEIASKFSYELLSYRWDGEMIVIEGNFCNQNADYHLRNMEIMFISVADMQGRELGVHIMDEATMQNLRIPAQSKIPYRFKVYPHPNVEASLHTELHAGLQLAFLSDFRTGSCIGKDCTWCYPVRESSA